MGTQSNLEIKERYPKGYDCLNFYFVSMIFNLGVLIFNLGVAILNLNFHI